MTASLPGMQDGKNVDCDRYFLSLIQHLPGYAHLGILGPDGYTRCHALGSGKKAFLGDRAYFRNAITQRRFVAGPYALLRQGGIASDTQENHVDPDTATSVPEPALP